MTLKEVREARGLQQNELAARMRYEPSNVCAVESGDRRPWPTFRRRAALALKMSEQEIFGDSDD